MKWPLGLGFQQRKTAKQIADWIRENGVDYRPISESRAVECEHGAYGWNDCLDCATKQLADDIESGAWFNTTT